MIGFEPLYICIIHFQPLCIFMINFGPLYIYILNFVPYMDIVSFREGGGGVRSTPPLPLPHYGPGLGNGHKYAIIRRCRLKYKTSKIINIFNGTLI